MADTRPLIERLAPDDAERLAALIDERDCWRTEVLGLRADLAATYRERAHLVALLAAKHPSHIGHTDPTAPDWAVITIELPTGQACWHIAPDDMDLFRHVKPALSKDRPWDGHSTDEKYARIRHLTAQTAVHTNPEKRAQFEQLRANVNRYLNAGQDQR